ncbi:MAG: HIT domain-containing protein [Clostridia bacterium]|nr:HIT domain-containing protein [Clostridia bacterium]
MTDCVFCKIAAGEIPGMKVYEDARTLAFMDTAGDVDGHILIIPKAHRESIMDCEPGTLHAVMDTVQRVCAHLTRACGYTGVNLLNANGESAGQSVPHFHIHLIPRKPDDSIDAWPRFPGAAQEIQSVFERVRMTER